MSGTSRALYPVARLRAIEAAAKAQCPAGTLMRRAGFAGAALARALRLPGEAPVLVLAGPGDNGGDALHVAAHLAHDGCAVDVILLGEGASDDAQQALALARASSARIHPLDAAMLQQLGAQRWSLVVDGLFGIGLARPLSGLTKTLVEQINRLPCPVLALDVPSGLDAASGTVVGPDGIAIAATHTLTFIGDKPGLHTASGCDLAGVVTVASLDIPQALFDAESAKDGVATPDGSLVPRIAYLNGITLFATCLRSRARDSHKGTFGDVKVLGGAQGMHGAVILAARAAAYCGAGRVFAGFLDAAPAYDPPHPELMCRQAGDIALQGGCIVAGPGMGQSPQAHDLLTRVLAAPGRCVLDADALNLIAGNPGLREALAQRGRRASGAAADLDLITPHPLEVARLLDTSAADVQANRLQAAQALAQHYGVVAVLKGAGTVMAHPDGRQVINPTGNPALATGGTGDVLAGVCGALMAQSWPTWEAALGAVWMHGAAADALTEEGVGPVGLLASDLPPALRTLFNTLIRDHDHTLRAR